MHVMGSVSPANEREAFSFVEDGLATVALSSTASPAPSRFTDIKGNHTPPAPAPPPPLLPPPPPPPPPPFSGPGELEGRNQKKKRVRSFFWKTIPEEQVKGRPNLWTRGPEQQQYQIDIQTVEELFGQSDSRPETKASLSRGGGGRSSLREAKEEVSILDSKRGMNIGIFLKQFKKSTRTILDDIGGGNSEPYGAEPLRELLKLLPDAEEVQKLRAYTGDVSKLSMADSFLYQLVLLPSYAVRIESMLLKEEFPAACEAMARDVSVLRRAATELMGCDELHAVLHLVLQAGNILNAGGYAGNAVGFKLSSLLSLADTKANKPGMNLLHFVALEAQKKDERLLKFPMKLTHIQAAARISLETLDAELQWITSRTRSVEESVQRDTELLQQLDSFLQRATTLLCSLRHTRQQLKKEGSDLIDFFCEDRDTFRLDDCFSIFHTFCSRFTDAVKENIEREAKEEARRRRLQQLEEQKRHSWAGGEEVVGVFRLHCSDSDMAQHDTAGLLMKPHPHSPLNSSHSPPGHWGSLRRSRKSPWNSPSFAAERDLSVFLEMGAHNRKVAHHRGGSDARTALPLASSASELRSPGPSPWTQAHSPKVTMFHHPQNQQQVGRVAAQPSPPKNSDAHQTITSYLMKPTSDLNQQFDYNNNGNDQQHLDPLSNHRSPSGLKGEPTNTSRPDLDFKHGPAAPAPMAVVLETCTLVPELKGFEKVHPPRHLHRCQQDDVVVTDVEQGPNRPSVRKVQNKSHTGETETFDMNSSQREEDKVVVWCVTGVCKAAGELTHASDASKQAEKDPCRRDNQGGSQQASSVAASYMPSQPEPAEVPPAPVPISSQPVPVSRCDDLSLQVSSRGWNPAVPESTNEVPAFTTGASDEGKEEEVSQGKETEGSTNEKKVVETLVEQSSDHQNQRNTAILSTNEKAALSTSSKPSTKSHATKTQPTGTKPTATNASVTSNKSKAIRTLTSSESQGMRRVVPISRTGRNFSTTGKRPETSLGHHQGSSSAAALASLTISSPNSKSLRQRERPSTAPSSRRSSINKTPDSKGNRASPQKQEIQRRPSIQKASTKPKPQPEEKMCRSTLRALSLAGEGSGGRGSISAPATPLHKGTTNPSSPLPGFARSTASSSFRWTSSNLTSPGPPRSESSPKSSPKTTTASTSPKPGTSSAFIRTGSLRASITSRSSDVLSQPSTLKRSQSIRIRPNSPSLSSLAPPKGHQQNDSGSFSDKSTHSRDSSRTTRPSWR